MSASRQIASVAGLIFVCMQTSWAQDIQVSPNNKTVEVTVTETVQVGAEVAVLLVGYQNYGRTKEACFEENVRVANRIIDALQKSNVGKQDIETEELRVQQIEPAEKWSQEMKTARQYGAKQAWNVRVPVGQAQEILDLAIRAGANDIDDVEWSVKDPAALEVKATGAALGKARALATRMAMELGSKLGELLYASNTLRRPKGWPFSSELQTSMSVASRKEIPLKLFPKKVEQQATVHAVFAIE